MIFQEPAAADHHQAVPACRQVSAASQQVKVVDTDGHQGPRPHQRRQQLLLPHHHRVHRVLQHRPGPHGSHEGSGVADVDAGQISFSNFLISCQYRDLTLDFLL